MFRINGVTGAAEAQRLEAWVPRSDDQNRMIERAVRAHHDVVRKWLIGRLGNCADADDVLQSVYLRIWRYAEDHIIENPRALMFTTAARLATNELVRRRRQLSRDGGDGEQDGTAAVEADAPDPEQQRVLREDVERTLAAIGDLPAKPRRAFELSRFEGRTYAEIAGLLEVSESSVEKYMITALKTLRTRLRIGESATIVDFEAARKRSG
ncbi:MAG: RNA polymerase sigma factor [Pacificimonas sp.]|nr:RNA polymerase sigma factor [Pacificimonas sp.]